MPFNENKQVTPFKNYKEKQIIEEKKSYLCLIFSSYRENNVKNDEDDFSERFGKMKISTKKEVNNEKTVKNNTPWATSSEFSMFPKTSSTYGSYYSKK